MDKQKQNSNRQIVKGGKTGASEENNFANYKNIAKKFVDDVQLQWLLEEIEWQKEQDEKRRNSRKITNIIQYQYCNQKKTAFYLTGKDVVGTKMLDVSD